MEVLVTVLQVGAHYCATSFYQTCWSSSTAYYNYNYFNIAQYMYSNHCFVPEST
jgi:hypothetical protein